MAPETSDSEATRIVVRLDDLLHARRMTLTELADGPPKKSRRTLRN